MKLNVILFALVCLGLLALALAHDGAFSLLGWLQCNTF
jgi:hypothetical protein